MRLSDCSKDELTILVALVALTQQLPAAPEKYTRAIGEIRSKYFGIPGRQRAMPSAGFVDSHEARVTSRWQ